MLIAMIVGADAQKFKCLYQGIEFRCKLISNRSAVSIEGFSTSERNVTIPSSVTYRGMVYPVKTVSTYSTIDFYSAETLTLEEGITDIDNQAFKQFRKLKEVTLPSTISHIGKKAFRNDKITIHQAGNIDEASVLNGYEWWAVKTSSTPRNNVVQTPKTKQRNVGGDGGATQQPVLPAENVMVDVDFNIPINKTGSNPDTYCVIIANEKYSEVADVSFAAHDGEVFREYCVKTLGIPEKQVKTYINATYTDVKKAFNQIMTFANLMDGKAKILFYYAGHGIPSENDQSAYLLPVDASPLDLTTCYKLSDIYALLGNANIMQSTVLLDACFSGVSRGTSDALVAARGVAIAPRAEKLNGNLIVFTATKSNETALSYKEKRHGMFTYYLLSELKKSRGNATFGDLFRSVTTDVKKSSFVENDKLQTPSVYISPSMSGAWENMHF